MAITKTEKFPLDFDALDYGDVIETEVIENAFNIKRNDRSFGIALMNMGTVIQKEMAARGKPCVTRTRNDKVIILKHGEAVDYTNRKFKAGIKKSIVAHAQSMRIDVSKLIDSEKERLHENQRYQTHILAGIENGRKLSALEVEQKKLEKKS